VGYPVVHINNFLAYRNSAGYPALCTLVKYEPWDIPQFRLKGLSDTDLPLKTWLPTLKSPQLTTKITFQQTKQHLLSRLKWNSTQLAKSVAPDCKVTNNDSTRVTQVFYRKKSSYVGTTVFCDKFFQSPRLTTANFPHTAIYFFYGPLNPTKYAIFAASNRNWQIEFVYQTNWQYFR